MSGRYVKNLVGDVPKEGGNLAGGDQFAEPHGGVAINCCSVVTWHV
jgi:hypothetical protein